MALPPDPWLRGDSVMADLIRAHDWAATPLGPIALWPQSLKTIVGLMLSSRSMMSLVWGLDAIHLYNDPFTELLREHATLALGRSAFETFAQSRDVFADDLANGMAGESTRLQLQRYPVLRNGRLDDAWFDVDYTPVRDEAGDVAGVLWTLKETTAQHRAEQALRESDARHRLLVESWAQALWETDASGVIIADSPSWRAFTGQTLQEWLGNGWLDAIHPDDRPGAEQHWRAATAAHGLVDAEFRLRAPGGGWRWTNVRAAPVRDAGGGIAKWAGMNIDIDARKHAETALRASQERQAFLLEVSDALRSMEDPSAVQATALKLLAERLHVMRASYYELEDDQDSFRLTARFESRAAPIPERMRLSDFSPALLIAYTAGRTLAVSDTAIEGEFVPNPEVYARVGVGAWAAVPLVRNGRLVAWLGVHSATPRSWSPADLQALEDVAERTWGAVERARAEQALVRSETKYRALFDSIDEGFCIIEMLFDDQGNAFDYAFLESNPVFEQQAGFTIVRGQRMREIAPDHEPHWFDIYGRIAQTGEPARFEDEAAAFGIVYDVYAFRVDDPALRRVAVVFRNITESKRAEQALRESEERFAQFAASSSDALWIREAATLRMEYTSPAIQTIYGIPPDAILGEMRRWVELIVPEDRETAVAHIRQAQSGASVTHEFRIRRPSDGEERWIRNTDFPLRDEHGRVQRIGGIAQDITEAKRSGIRLEILVNELQHRARNLLGVVNVVASRTLVQGAPIAPFEERMQALSRAQGLLSQGGSDSVEVGALVRAELAAHANGASERISITGPEAYLSARQVQNFALALHELTTNAVKYGALKGDTGHLTVTWEFMLDRRDRRRLALNWVESGVHVEPDKITRRGYGTELIQEALAYALQARIDYTLGADGVRCRIEMAVSGSA